MIGDDSFDNCALKYYMLNYLSSHGYNLEQIVESGIIRNSGDMNLFQTLFTFSKTSNQSHQEASHVAGFIIAANMFSHPGAFLPPETTDAEYTLPFPGDNQLFNLIARERARKNEGSIVTGGYLDGRICAILNKEKDESDPLIIFSSPLYTVVKRMGIKTAELLDIFLPEKKGNGEDYFHNARLTSGLGAALLYNPENHGSNFVYMLQESPQGEVGWGILTKIQVRYRPGQPDKNPIFPVEYTYTQYTLLKKEELEERGIGFNPELHLPGAEDTYLVRLKYSMNTEQLPNTKLKLEEAKVLDVKDIFAA